MTGKLAAAFNTAMVPFVWREIEAREVVFAIGKKGGARPGIVDHGEDRPRQEPCQLHIP